MHQVHRRTDARGVADLRAAHPLQHRGAVKAHLVFLVLAACSSKPANTPNVLVLNGLDIPVVVSIDSEGGKQKLELAPRARAAPTGLSGKATVKVTTRGGELVSESEARLGTKRVRSCYYVVNVMGSAAYVYEDVVYGTGFGTPAFRRGAGEITSQECSVSFAFEDPPETITVGQYAPKGDNRGWLHYEGDGGWVVAVNALLDDTGQWASQSRGKAQRIVRTVVTHDPDNAALPAIAERLRQMQLVVPEPSPGNLLEQPKRRPRRSQ